MISRYCSGAPCSLPSFPTRRSSDLPNYAFSGGPFGIRRLQPIDRGRRQAGILFRRPACSRSQGRLVRELGENRSESTRLNSSHLVISYAVFCLKKKTDTAINRTNTR